MNISEINRVIDTLKKIDIYNLKHINGEESFEKYVFKLLDAVVDKKYKLIRQTKSYKEGRQMRPDISIGNEEVLIELKFNLKNLNDIYRLYYQAIKYSKIASDALILCVHDPKEKLLKSDIIDLEKISKVKVIHIY